VRLHLFEHGCARCHAEFKAPHLVGRYGEFLLRSTGRDAEAYLDTFTDGVFDEVSELLDGVPGVPGVPALDAARLSSAGSMGAKVPRSDRQRPSARNVCLPYSDRSRTPDGRLPPPHHGRAARPRGGRERKA
jgi:hypothetical protein